MTSFKTICDLYTAYATGLAGFMASLKEGKADDGKELRAQADTLRSMIGEYQTPIQASGNAGLAKALRAGAFALRMQWDTFPRATGKGWTPEQIPGLTDRLHAMERSAKKQIAKYAALLPDLTSREAPAPAEKKTAKANGGKKTRKTA